MRYLDDIGGLWQYSPAEFEVFLSTLNNYHPRIKLQHVMDPVKINFLDTEVSFRPKEDALACKQLATKVYFK